MADTFNWKRISCTVFLSLRNGFVRSGFLLSHRQKLSYSLSRSSSTTTNFSSYITSRCWDTWTAKNCPIISTCNVDINGHFSASKDQMGGILHPCKREHWPLNIFKAVGVQLHCWRMISTSSSSTPFPSLSKLMLTSSPGTAKTLFLSNKVLIDIVEKSELPIPAKKGIRRLGHHTENL